MNRLPNLDALRFFLASFVIIFHIPQLSRNQGLPYFDSLAIFHKGTEAVYMFFVLSGFLIIKLIYRAKLKESFSIKKFYMRRVLRILPLYYLIVFFGLIFYNLILPALNIPFEINYTLQEGLFWTILFMPNVFSVVYAPGGILEVLWSIGIEEQFYLFIAPLMFLVNKKHILNVLFIIGGIYFVFFHLNTFEALRKFSFVYFYLFFGGIISILEEQNKLNFLKKSFWSSLIVIALTIIYYTTNILVFESKWFESLVTSLLFSMFILTLSYNNFGFEIRNRVLNYFGKISYGIYMYHVIALNLVVFLFLEFKKINLFNDITTIFLINIFTFALTIFMAHISDKYFEMFFLKQKTKYR